MLLENGADANVSNKDRWAPILLASHTGHIEVVKLLLEKGAEATDSSPVLAA
ncbi:serine threonine-protein kinase [Colletotrichum incanum]|nr:serine threonine-protein kinase [Colletotrichum incanum]